MEHLTISNDKLNLNDLSINSKILFDECENLDININKKILKLGFFDCKDIRIKTNGIIHKIEIYKSHNIFIKCNGNVPLFDIQNSTNICISNINDINVYAKNVMYILHNNIHLNVGIWDEKYFKSIIQ